MGFLSELPYADSLLEAFCFAAVLVHGSDVEFGEKGILGPDDFWLV